MNASREQAFLLQGSNCFCYVSTKEISVVGENGVFMRSVQKKKKTRSKNVVECHGKNKGTNKYLCRVNLTKLLSTMASQKLG